MTPGPDFESDRTERPITLLVFLMSIHEAGQPGRVALVELYEIGGAKSYLYIPLELSRAFYFSAVPAPGCT